jgi:hypothetical protein
MMPFLLFPADYMCPFPFARDYIIQLYEFYVWGLGLKIGGCYNFWTNGPRNALLEVEAFIRLHIFDNCLCIRKNLIKRSIAQA